MSEPLTDDEAIAMAMLLDCTFWHNGWDCWFIWYDEETENTNEYHPLEKARLTEWEKIYDLNKVEHRPHWGWTSKAELARDYLDWWRNTQRGNHDRR
jgi:hypothetical protein